MANLFRQAKQLLDKRAIGLELTEEEQEVVNVAIIPLNLRGCPFSDGITIAEGLEELAKIVEEENAKEEG